MRRELKELLSGLPMKGILNGILDASALGHLRIRSLWMVACYRAERPAYESEKHGIEP